MRLSVLQGDFLAWLASGEQDDAARLPLADARGLAVYQNNYRASLMACLADSFPQVHAWLGEAAFQAAAARHIDRVPPHSWTLDDYATGFPPSLIEDYPDDEEVGDLARIELALSQSFVAADAPALRPEMMAQVDWERAKLQAIPALAILPLRSNAGEIWVALADGAPPPAAQLTQGQSPLLIWRRDGLCRLRPLDAGEAAMLAPLASAPTPFADLCQSAIETWGEDHGIERIGQWLSGWVSDGLIVLAGDCLSLPEAP